MRNDDYVLTDNAARYEKWEKTRDVIWYDTAGCLTGAFVGQANSGTITPAGGSNFMNNWI